VQIKALVRPLLLLVIAMGGFGGFIGNSILMSLNTAMPASLLYPLVNGGIAVIVAIMSCVIFKEKLTLQRALTILVGLAAIVTLNL
jgi:multidrug transporter EmrE-like cation transporter